MHYGLIGYPLSHSFSPAYFRKKFAEMQIACLYEAYPIADIAELPGLLAAHPHISGLNVTIPYKESVLPHLHEIDEMVAVTGACNCISIKDGYRKGYNTDVTGFEQSLIPLLRPQHNMALILGNGGASKAVRYVLTQLGIPYSVVSRDGSRQTIGYTTLTPAIIDAHKLIINTTPLGMYPDVAAAPPIPYDSIGDQHLLYDLIYNPEETQFLANGRERGAVTKNGFEMLVLQAEASWDIWTRPERGE
ncbi:shikimate dehydrogenase [Nemorincola caseinilytica]|uniref:Shikimate dehydrogenase n=1 Tax=Nemorincola caseinilytica TaxID=2054315 RepID=A0ABP8NB29_9BACT